ncbi:cathelicidin antimicrobial peptide [Ochotona princeps]|uniref:cathelicidin antimicrobial peptide n=1 Tax=Ochotona princeps TaxID=9978 RepID=UPI00032ADFB1|nr:cathelicidin antimicrobial peptide [Ochotona princeps]
METQRRGVSLLPLLLLGLVMPVATTQILSYQQAVLRAVDSFNQRSFHDNLFRLLDLESQPPEDNDPNTPKPVKFTVKETVCPKTAEQLPEQCDFKKEGLVEQCVGTVMLNQARESFDLNCDAAREATGLRKSLRKARKKIKKAFRKFRHNIPRILPYLPRVPLPGGK